MRLLFVSGLTAHGRGGAQAETIRLISGIATRGVEVGVVIDQPLAVTNVRYFPIDYPPTNRAAGQVRDAMAIFRPDMVHVVGGGISFLRQIDITAQPVPWLFTAHNVPPRERTAEVFYGRNKLYYFARDARALPSTLAWKAFLRMGSFRAVIAHSDVVVTALAEYGCPEIKIHKVPFGFDVPELPDDGTSPFPAGSSPKILSIAGVVHHKGLHDLVRAIAMLRHRFGQLTCCILGERRYEGYAAYLERLINEAGVAGSVFLISNADDATKAAALRDADIYVQASHEEGFCLAFAEAAAFVPRLVGTQTGEIAGLAAGDQYARVVPPKNPEALLDAMEALLSVEALDGIVDRRRDRLIQRYSWNDYFDKHMTAYTA